MPLGMEVGLGQGDIVLDGDLAPPERGTAAPLYGLCLLWPNDHPSQLVLSTCSFLSCTYFRYTLCLKKVSLLCLAITLTCMNRFR